jgi:hypothetical protein
VIVRQKQELARQQQELAATAQQLQEVCSLLALKNDSLSHLTRHSSMLETQVRVGRGRCVPVLLFRPCRHVDTLQLRRLCIALCTLTCACSLQWLCHTAQIGSCTCPSSLCCTLAAAVDGCQAAAAGGLLSP